MSSSRILARTAEQIGRYLGVAIVMALEIQKDIQHPLIKPALKRQAKNPDHNSLLKLREPIFQLRAIQIQVP